MLYLVTNHLNPLELSMDDATNLMHNVMNHDRSKFSINQFKPYVEITEYHYQKAQGTEHKYTDDIQKIVDKAINEHYLVENHHPQRLENSLSTMNKYELIEVICDLQAMANEFNKDSCRDYFIQTWVVKHKKYFKDFNTVYMFMIKVIECFES